MRLPDEMWYTSRFVHHLPKVGILCPTATLLLSRGLKLRPPAAIRVHKRLSLANHSRSFKNVKHASVHDSAYELLAEYPRDSIFH